MAVIYLVFNEGYTATAGEDWMRPALATEALRLARLLSSVARDEPEVFGLQALLELQASRFAARLDDHGEPVLLESQDRTRWDQSMIQRGLVALQQAEHLAATGQPVGQYFLQAAIAAQHARSEHAENTNWRRIAMLYDLLAGAAPGPTIEVNRAVAYGRAFGPEAGMAVLDALDSAALRDSPLVPSVRADLFERSGQHRMASETFAEVAKLSRNASERAVLRRRAAENLAQSRHSH